MSVWVREQLQSAKHTVQKPGRDVTAQFYMNDRPPVTVPVSTDSYL